MRREVEEELRHEEEGEFFFAWEQVPRNLKLEHPDVDSQIKSR